MTGAKKKTTYTLKKGKGILAVEYKLINLDAPTIIFLHDSLGCITLWRDFPERLSDALQCNYFIYDRWGYGNSSRNKSIRQRDNDYLTKEADILIELILAFSIKQPILFGHSDGGSIALIAAAKSPSLIAGLISQAGHIFVENITLKGIKAAVKRYLTTDFRAKLMKYHGSKVDDVFFGWTGIWLSDDFRKWDISPLLSKITSPLLLIQGKNDEYGTLKQVNIPLKLVSGYSNSLIIPNVGHAPHKEKSDLVIKEISKFVITNLIL